MTSFESIVGLYLEKSRGKKGERGKAIKGGRKRRKAAYE